MAALRRLTKELRDIIKDPLEGVETKPITEENIYIWEATVKGPDETPYEHGIFRLRIHFPNEYPYRPPKVKFETKIFHPNISPTGDICLDILRDRWSPALTITRVLLSILSILSDPNPNDPLVPDVAIMYKNNKELYDKTARHWTEIYASK